MKNTFLFLALLLSYISTLFAQEECVYVEWASFPDTNAVYQEAEGIAVDSFGNSYLTGHFSGTASFGNFTVTSEGAYDLFVAKIDPDGDFVWVTTAGKRGMQYRAYGENVTVDQSGNVYISARYEKGIDIHNTTLSHQVGSNLIAKLNPQGQFEWVEEIQQSEYTVVRAPLIDLDPSGNLYVTDVFSSSITLGNTTLAHPKNIYIAKLNPQGQFMWARQVDAGHVDHIKIDMAGNAYIAGTLNGYGVFDTFDLSVASNDLLSSFYIAKLNPQGQFVWANYAGIKRDSSHSSGEMYLTGMDIDEVGNMYMIGTFKGKMIIGADTLISDTTFNSTNIRNTFISKADAQGNFTHAMKFNGIPYPPNHSYSMNRGGMISCYLENLCFISGYFLHGIEIGGETVYVNNKNIHDNKNGYYLAKMIIEEGFDFPWIAPIKSKYSGNNYSLNRNNNLTSDRFGNIYLVGASIDTTAISSRPWSDTFDIDNYVPMLATKISSISADITFQNGTYTALQSGVDYQWLDCNNNWTPVPGATSQTFTPPQDGNYAVVVTNQFCSDTSACMGTTNIEEHGVLGSINIYPNPAFTQISISGIPEKSDIRITDISGRMIYQEHNLKDRQKDISTKGWSNGIYFIEMRHGNSRMYEKVVVNQ